MREITWEEFIEQCTNLAKITSQKLKKMVEDRRRYAGVEKATFLVMRVIFVLNSHAVTNIDNFLLKMVGDGLV